MLSALGTPDTSNSEAGALENEVCKRLVAAGLTVSAAGVISGTGLATTLNTLDLFLVAGQSNAQGQGVAGTSVTVPTGKVLQFYNGVFTDANDPVGNANTGSAWPSLGLAYYNATGRKLCFVPAAVAGTTQSAADDRGLGNWSAGATLFLNANAAVTAAMAAATLAGYTPLFRGILWSQGESDGDAINGVAPTTTQAAYQASFIAMIAAFRAIYGAQMPFYIFQTGYGMQGGGDSGYAQIRAAQRTVRDADAYTSIVFDVAVDFRNRGLMQGDGYHYTQPGYNEMGHAAASSVVTAVPAPFLGVPITPLFAAGDFTSSGVGTFVVTSGQVTTYQYVVVGKMMTVWWMLDSTTITGTPTVLTIQIPAGRIAAKRVVCAHWYNNGSWAQGYGFVAPGATVISLQKDPPASAFAAGANTVYLYGSISFPITF